MAVQHSPPVIAIGEKGMSVAYNDRIFFMGGGDVGLMAVIVPTSSLTDDSVTWYGLWEGRDWGFGGDPQGMWMVL